MESNFKEKYEYIGPPINKGGFSIIYRIKDKKVKTEYILKKIPKLNTDEKTFINEVDFLKNIKGKNIINIIDFYSNLNDEY